MGCPESLELLKKINDQLELDNVILRPRNASLYDGLCSSIGSTPKALLADDSKLPQDAEFARLTLKVRTLGSNTYIAFGVTSQNYRFTAVSQSQTLIAPMINGSTIPFIASNITIKGDNGANDGVVELTGIRMYRTQSKDQIRAMAEVIR